MIKLLLILLVGLVLESVGVVFLKKGMDRIGEVKQVNTAEIVRVMKAGATNPQILLGIFFETLFFVVLLVLMAKTEISVLWPLTGLSFVFATFAAILFLGERVSAVRWTGVVLIVIGAVFISYSEKAKPAEASTTAPTLTPSK